MNWFNLASTLNNSFFFVIEKIIDLQGFFIGTAKSIGRIVLLIAILSAALNYALTGTGLKDNIIKITKATLFFLIVVFAYPSIISFITSWTFGLAQGSVYPSVSAYMNEVTGSVERKYDFIVPEDPHTTNVRYNSYTNSVVSDVKRDNMNLFSNMTVTRNTKTMNYTAIAPAAALQIMLLLAGECIKYSDEDTGGLLPEFSRVLKGLVCAFFIILTGVFALLEYCICFLEFMLVASVGVILLPFSIWDGSKFLSEKFIGAIVGFFMKLLFCNVAIFLLIYGFISLFYTFDGNGFQGSVDQIIFIIFVCLLFFYICKSAPGIAQSLLTGIPSLSATGAISAAAGAVGAAVTVGHMAGSVMNKGKQAAGTIVGGGIDMVGGLQEAGAAAGAVKDAGGSGRQQAAAFFSSLKDDVGDKLAYAGHGLTRSLLNNSNSSPGGGQRGAVSDSRLWSHDFKDKLNAGNEKPFEDYFNERKAEGAERGNAYAKKAGLIQSDDNS